MLLVQNCVLWDGASRQKRVRIVRLSQFGRALVVPKESQYLFTAAAIPFQLLPKQQSTPFNDLEYP